MSTNVTKILSQESGWSTVGWQYWVCIKIYSLLPAVIHIVDLIPLLSDQLPRHDLLNIYKWRYVWLSQYFTWVLCEQL